MRILLMTNQFPPEMIGTGHLLGELSEDLTRAGHRLTVLAGPVQHSFEEIPAPYRRTLFRREQLAGADVIRANGPPLRNMWVRKVFSLFYFPLVALLGGLLLRRHDVILCPSPFAKSFRYLQCRLGDVGVTSAST